ncbi:protein RKD4-like [Ipomoea triloba]|uniref:protein RKD4-like n=1 Tax=Ipomoea triloba TaxID=35885 RepID=UPI00125CDB47|nr:protein RKD4-like [Ipomoea triloba]
MANTTHSSSPDNSSFWDEIHLSPLRDSAQSTDITVVETFENATPEPNEIIDVVVADQVTDVVVVEDNTTAAVDVANINANVFIGRKRTRRTFCDTTTLTFEMFSKYFYLTADQAAEELQVGRATFKKKCREVGISYWPYRKLEFGEIKDPAELQWVMKELEDEKKAILQNPNIELVEATTRLRDKSPEDIQEVLALLDEDVPPPKDTTDN